ncbi:uncharacterized protein TNCV_1091021 [Trichonephila clavipes]|uniref:Uncharacterized protein n=1 Tax=Trichonephila clavipes TaxID=2585209 RepID=A0A8X6VLB7_TRICX|nr:uncharacterized protein TNCV_1091021 [Trichonephila clavipes]
MRSSKRQFSSPDLHVVESTSMIQGTSTSTSRISRTRNVPPVDDKILFERLWKGTFRAIVEASLQARESNSLTCRRNTLRSVVRKCTNQGFFLRGGEGKEMPEIRIVLTKVPPVRLKKERRPTGRSG